MRIPLRRLVATVTVSATLAAASPAHADPTPPQGPALVGGVVVAPLVSTIVASLLATLALNALLGNNLLSTASS